MSEGQKVIIFVIILSFILCIAATLVVAHGANQVLDVVATGIAATPTS